MSLIKKFIAGNIILGCLALTPAATAYDHLKELISAFDKGKGNFVEDKGRINSKFLDTRINDIDYSIDLNYSATPYFILKARDASDCNNSFKLIATHDLNIDTITYSGNWSAEKSSGIINNLLDYIKNRGAKQ